VNKKVTAFIDGLISYDYILFGSAFILFIFFVIVGILLRRRIFLAVLFVLLAFFTLTLLPTLGYVTMHDYLFKNSIKLQSQQKLSFTKAVVIKGSVMNESERDFSECKISASAYKVTKNKYKNYLLKFKPFQKASMFTPEIAKGESYDFKFFMEPFSYTKDYNISLGADCK